MRKTIPLTILLLTCLFSLGANELAETGKANPNGSEVGYASWYGGKFQGRQTASGEIFDTYQYTAAHKTLPFGTLVKVTNLENQKIVSVRINDRGPFVEGRIIDLSYAAANALEMVGQGIARVKIEVVSSPAGLKPEHRQMPENGTVIIQVGSYGNRTNAEATLQKLKNAGFSGARLENASGGLLRVIVANVPQGETQSALNRLAALGFSSPLVRRNQ